jgi:hypothetical protein
LEKSSIGQTAQWDLLTASAQSAPIALTRKDQAEPIAAAELPRQASRTAAALNRLWSDQAMSGQR